MNIWIFPGSACEFLATVGGPNERAIEELVDDPMFDTSQSSHDLAARLRALAENVEPTHGCYFPTWGESPDVATVALKLAALLEERPDAPWNTSSTPPHHQGRVTTL